LLNLLFSEEFGDEIFVTQPTCRDIERVTRKIVAIAGSSFQGFLGRLTKAISQMTSTTQRIARAPRANQTGAGIICPSHTPGAGKGVSMGVTVVEGVKVGVGVGVEVAVFV
jgi:hypothetical protein